MATLIAKRIQKTDSEQSNGSYAHALIAYVTQPDAQPMPGEDADHKPVQEKCVAVETLGFSSDSLTPKEAAQEMRTLCRSVEDGDKMNLVSHWCISWKGDAPSQANIMSAAKDLLADMGYGPDHQAVIGIHTDTENTHVHIVACRASTVDGSVLQEGQGWHKLEAQRFLARSALKYGWETPEGCKFAATGETEKIFQTNKFTGEIVERERPVVGKAKTKTEKPKALRDRAVWSELKTGIRSHLGMLQDTMHRLRDEITDKLKWGHVLKLAAEQGIEIKLADHGGKQGLTYSLDGERWESGSAVGPEFTLQAMESRIGKRYRHARENVHDIAREARKDMIDIPTHAAEAKTSLSREQVAALRSIPIEEVRKRLGVEPTDSKKVRNGLDVAIYEMSQTYDQATKTLAQAFPEVVSDDGLINTVATDSYRARLSGSGLPDSLHRTAGDCMRQIDAFGCEKFHVYAAGDGIGYTSKKEHPEGMTQADLLKTLPQLARMNTDKNAAIYFAPVHAENKISIPVDDVQQALLDKHRPSLVFATSDRSQQAHYVIEKKYSEDFYDWLTRKVNNEHGDPKILRASHDTRLAGFTNRKKEKIDGTGGYPYAKIVQHTPLKCTSFEQYADAQYKVYEQEVKQQAELPKEPTAPAQNQNRAEVGIDNLAAVLEQRKAKEVWKGEKHRANEYMKLQRVPVPAEMSAEASSYQGAIRKQYGENLDRSKSDAMIAKHMYAVGANRDEVYSWMLDHMAQDKTPVARKHSDGTAYTAVKNASDEQRDRAARRVAVNMEMRQTSPVRVETSSGAHNAILEEKRAANLKSAWERREMLSAMPAPVPTPARGPGRDKVLAEERAEQEAKEAMAKAVEAAAKAKAEAEALEARKRVEEQEYKDKLKKWKKAAAKVQPKPYYSHDHGHGHGGSSSTPTSGPRM